MLYKLGQEKEIKNISFDGFTDMFTGSSVTTISEKNALKNSDIVYSCINLIASTIAKMPVNLYEETNDGKAKVNTEVSYLLKTRANELTSAIDFKQSMVANMLNWGNAYAYIVTKRGIPSELIILDSSITKLEKINGKLFVVTLIDSKEYKIKYEQVIHLKDLTVDGLNGISRIRAIKNKLENKANSDNLLKNFYSTGGAVKGVLNVPASLNSEAKKKLKAGFNDILNSNSNGIAVLDDGITFTSASKMNLSDAEFVNNMKLTKEDIAAIFGVPLPMLSSTDGTSYNNMTEMNRNFIQTLITIVEKFEQEITYKLLTFEQRLTQYFKCNVSVALRANDLDRANYYSKMISNGLMSINECRRLEEFDDVEGGDEYYRTLNWCNIKWADEYQLRKAGATTEDLGEVKEDK